MHRLTRRSLRLTDSDRVRISTLRQRSGLYVSSSSVLLAALAHQQRQLPLGPELVEQLQAQLDIEDRARHHITSFSLRDIEDRQLQVLVASLGRSITSTVRLALLVFAADVDSSLCAQLLALPARARRGPSARLRINT